MHQIVTFFLAGVFCVAKPAETMGGSALNDTSGIMDPTILAGEIGESQVVKGAEGHFFTLGKRV